jgi:hypothetical protein
LISPALTGKNRIPAFCNDKAFAKAYSGRFGLEARKPIRLHVITGSHHPPALFGIHKGYASSLPLIDYYLNAENKKCQSSF